MCFKDECELTIQDGLGITSVPGIKAAGIHAGFRKDPKRKDMALIVADEPCVAAGLFTTNIFCAAPVTVCHQNIADARVKAIVINSGNANAATGEPGIETAKATCEIVAAALGCDAGDVLPCSTGVIGVPLSTACFESGVPAAVAVLDGGIDAGHDAARAIMTTDTVPKEVALSYVCKERHIHIAGMCKGSGMIMPNMATMIAVVCTDAALTPEAAKAAFKQAVDGSFNCVTVDSDTSTNDTSILLATGKAGGKVIDVGSKSFDCFC
ncbi:MAG: bifunctional ornithine acetyltransferase/N-acetylglutamate synthase, partial [Coriobacteriales bacterium]|nr:bifunctional ornithine acetyltransferase/N-acetylglutamate synthase [Coriobacteriales bacterium]